MKKARNKVSGKSKALSHSLEYGKSEKQQKMKFLFRFKMPYVILFFFLWIFSSFIYDDVLYIAEQNIYFAFSQTLMQNIINMNDGFLILIGRCFMLAFHYPIWGGFLLALILTLTAWLIDYIFCLKERVRIIALMWPILFLLYIVYKGLNLFFMSEPGVVFAIPIILLCLLSLVAITIRIVKKRPATFPWLVGSTDNSSSVLFVYVMELVCIVGIMIFAISFRPNTRTVTQMQRMMQENDWEGMIDAAQKLKNPGRPVCCYYAIALSQTDQIGSRLFNIHYQYTDLHIKNRVGKNDNTSEYYSADGNFYAGLINTSYHGCMEQNVIDGITVYRLKRMFFCSLLNKELSLAEKYLQIISKMPFESSFVDQYQPMLFDANFVKNDVNLAKVAELIPVDDAFEQWFRTPLFLGYNVMLTSGRSMRALYNSLAACLYSKDLNSFFIRVQPFKGISLPKSFDEGLALYALKDTESLKHYNLSTLTLEAAKAFLINSVQYKGQDRKEVYYYLSPQYSGFYPLYYYFENIPDKNYTSNQSKSGSVN